MQNLAKEVQGLREEVATTSKDLRASQRENGKLQLMLDTKAADLVYAKQEYQTNLDVQKQEIERLKVEVASEKTRVNTIHEALITAETKVKIQEGKVNEKEEWIRVLERRIAEKEEIIGELEERLKDNSNSSLYQATKKAIEGASTYQDELQTVADEFAQRKEADERRIMGLEEELDERTKECENLQYHLDQMVRKHQKQMDRVSMYRRELNDSVEDVHNIRSSSPAVSLSNYERNAMERAKPAMAAGDVTKEDLDSKDFPKKTKSIEFADFYTTMQNYVAHLLSDGYADHYVAKMMVKSLNHGELGSNFLAKLKKEDRSPQTFTTQYVFSVLAKTDFVFQHLKPEQRFRSIHKGRAEETPAYMQRCEQGFDAAFPDERDMRGRFREIKERFIEGGDFPEHVKELLLACGDLTDLVLNAERLMKNRNNQQVPYQQRTGQYTGPPRYQQRQYQPRPQQQRQFDQQRGQNQTQQQAPAPQQYRPQQQQQIHQLNVQPGVNNNANNENQPMVAVATPVVLSPPRGLQKYPTSDEQDCFRPPPKDRFKAPQNCVRAPADARGYGYCTNCRQLDHPSQTCHFQSYCSVCELENSHEQRRCPVLQMSAPPVPLAHVA